MYSDIVPIAIILINLAGFFITIERPVWLFKVSKRIHPFLVLDTTRPILSFAKLLLLVPVVLALFFMNSNTVNLFFGIVFLLPFTLISLFKVLNAVVPPQTKRRTIVKVLDSRVYVSSGETETQQFVLYMVSASDLGVRVLPAYPLNDRIQFRSKSNISVFYRIGGLGFIYRFPYDEL